MLPVHKAGLAIQVLQAEHHPKGRFKPRHSGCRVHILTMSLHCLCAFSVPGTQWMLNRQCAGLKCSVVSLLPRVGVASCMFVSCSSSGHLEQCPEHGCALLAPSVGLLVSPPGSPFLVPLLPGSRAHLCTSPPLHLQQPILHMSARPIVLLLSLKWFYAV